MTVQVWKQQKSQVLPTRKSVSLAPNTFVLAWVCDTTEEAERLMATQPRETFKVVPVA